MEKLLQLEDRFPKSGEPTVQLVAWGDGRGGLALEKRAFVEGHSPLYDFLKTVQPEVGCSFLLVNALGAYEYYDANRNGDGFPSRPYQVGELASCGHPDCVRSLDGWVSEEETLLHHYKTFEKHGHIYRNHKNSDPSTTLGNIQKAIWNPRMHRVELLLKIYNDRAPDLAEKVQAGDAVSVSMGCLHVGTRITLHNGRGKNIEDIEVGDLVNTHRGRPRRVYELHRRDYKGVVHTIKSWGLPEIICTHEHPFYVVKKDQVRQPRSGWRADAAVHGEWKLAEELDPRLHYLLQPIDRREDTPEYATTALARFLGYYLAEGCILRDSYDRVKGVHFTVHKNDVFLGELPKLREALGLPLPVIATHHVSDKAKTVIVYDEGIGRLIASLVYGTAKTKVLHASVMKWAPELQRQLFGAYANGDGCEPSEGTLRVSTASKELSEQLLQMLPRFGVIGTAQTLKHQPSTIVTSCTTEYTVNVGKQWAQSLVDVCAKVRRSKVRAKKEFRKIIGDYVVVTIRSVTRVAGSMPVYNFEVEGDNSYVAEGIAVHNCHVRWDVCTICGHRAPTRAQYCQHAATQLRQTLPDGRLVAVLNPNPRFFDISFVYRPADMTGWMLKKVADTGVWLPSAELGERAQAYRDRAIEIRSWRSKTAQELNTPFGKLASETVAAWPGIEGKPLEVLASLTPTEAVSTLAACGVVLSGREVMQMVCKRGGLEPSSHTLDKLAALQPAFEEVLAQQPALAQKLGQSLSFRVDAVKTAALAPLADWVEKRGGISDYLRARAYAPSDTFQMGVGPGASHRAYDPPKTDIFTMTDPNTGAQYQTTRGAAQASSHEKAKSQLVGTAMLGALYAGGLKGALGRRAGLWTVPVGLAAGYATTKALKHSFPAFRNPTYMTDQGIPVDGGTEFAKVSGFERPDASDVVHAAAYEMRELSGSLLTEPSLREKVAALTDGAEIVSDEPGVPPSLDLGAFITNVSQLVWPD